MFEKIRVNQITVLCLIFVALIASGCTVAKISGRGTIPLMLNQPQQKVKVIKTLEAKKSMAFDYTGAFDASEVLNKFYEESEADAVINVVIILKTTVTDFLINMVTLGIANARTFVITGQAVKLSNKSISYINDGGSELIATADNPGELYSILKDQPYPQDCMIIRDLQNKSSFKLIRFIEE